MTVILTVLGSILLLAGVVLSFSRHDPTRDSETKVEYQGLKITATKPSIVLVLVGALLVVLPHIPGVMGPPPPKTAPIDILGPALGPALPPANLGSKCCFQGGACPMFAPEVQGAYCMCWDMYGNTAAGQVCL